MSIFGVSYHFCSKISYFRKFHWWPFLNFSKSTYLELNKSIIFSYILLTSFHAKIEIIKAKIVLKALKIFLKDLFSLVAFLIFKYYNFTISYF